MVNRMKLVGKLRLSAWNYLAGISMLPITSFHFNPEQIDSTKMERETSEHVEVRAESFFLEEQSSAEENHYVFAYRIKIRNLGNHTVQLLDRHWIITDSNGEVNEVRGDGVVGEQPVLAPGEDFEYTSGCHLKSEMGTMHLSYFLDPDGHKICGLHQG